MRAVARVADVSRNTVDKLLQNAGSAALDYQDQIMVNLPCRRVQWGVAGRRRRRRWLGDLLPDFDSLVSAPR